MRKTVLGIILCAVSLSNCQKEAEVQHRVPNVAVDLRLNLNLPQYNDLNFIGGWVYLNGGSLGIIAHRNGQDQFRAYDRHAPHNTAENCRVEVDSTGIVIFDPCSESEWLINDGQVLKGPANYPLVEYRTSYDGLTLRIFN